MATKNKSYWREHAAPIIRKIIQETPDKTDKEVRKLISAAYPFSKRAYHPYKIWCDEVARQMCQRAAIIAGRPIKQKGGGDPYADQPTLF